MSTSTEIGDRYFSLDVLRGLAALSVVVYHWHHFFFSPTRSGLDLPDPGVQPFYAALQPLYSYGLFAVDLFFSLSGFIFFCFYSRKVAERKVSWQSFAWLRFSRLYPLHFVTLLLVAVLQAFYLGGHGVYFVYQDNDPRLFVLQVLFASNWYPDDPLSFNGPAWSVSIEILLYMAFFLLCRFGSIRPPVLVCLAMAGALLSLRADFIGRGLFSFFLGGLCLQLLTWICAHGGRVEKAAKFALVLVIAGSLLLLASDVLISLAANAVELASSLKHKVIELARLERFLLGWYLRGVLFPAILLLLALVEPGLKRITKSMAWLGDISYSSYLLHFPLQLCVVMFLSYSGAVVNFRSPTIFLAYFGLLIALSLASFHYLERPAQSWLRRHRAFGDTLGSKTRA